MFPDWMLERFLVGELDAENTRRLTTTLATTPELKARLDALEADSRRILAQHPPELVERVVARRLAAAPPRRAWPRVALPGLVAVAALLLLLVVPRDGGEDVRLKGDGPSLRLFRLAAAGPERLFEGSPVRAHDVVQVAFELADKPHLVVVSIDGAGNATLHFPLDGMTSPPPGLKALPRSFELDDAPGYERFFLVTSDEPLSSTAVLDAARALARGPNPRTAPLPLPARASSTSVRLDKVNP
jgi:hypothetical protein